MNGTPDSEDVRFLNGLNRELKMTYPVDKRDAVLRRQYGMSQICINTRGCTAGLKGSCIFCNYPRGRGITRGSAESARIRSMLMEIRTEPSGSVSNPVTVAE